MAPGAAVLLQVAEHNRLFAHHPVRRDPFRAFLAHGGDRGLVFGEAATGIARHNALASAYRAA